MKLRRWFTLMVCVLGASFATAQNIESAAKLAYARLSFASQMYAIEQAVIANPKLTYDELNKIVAERSVSFEIHVNSSGDVSQIAAVPYSQSVSKPVGEDVILVGVVAGQYAKDAKDEYSFEARPTWTEGQSVGEDWTLPFAAAMKLSDAEQKRTPEQIAHRYVSMKVTATLGDRSLTHNALVLFSSESTPLIIDAVTNQSALAFFAGHSPFPGSLLYGFNTRTPAVERWLEEHSDPAQAAGDVACNLTILTCAVARADLDNIKPKLTGR